MVLFNMVLDQKIHQSPHSPAPLLPLSYMISPTEMGKKKKKNLQQQHPVHDDAVDTLFDMFGGQIPLGTVKAVLNREGGEVSR